MLFGEIYVKTYRCHLAKLLISDDKTNSILTQLGFIPPNLEFDMIEIKDEAQKERVLKMHPWIKDKIWIKNSDAHYLQDIGIYEDEIDMEVLNECWRKYL